MERLKSLFIKSLFMLSFIYIAFGWWIGLNYGKKPVIFGPYPDIPMVIRRSIMGIPLEKITDNNILVTLCPFQEAKKVTMGKKHSLDDSTYFNIEGYFEIPQNWFFDFPPLSETNSKYEQKKIFILTGNYSRAIAHEFKNPGRNLGYYTFDEFYDFLEATHKTKDLARLKQYFLPAILEEKYHWLYSDSVLLSSAMSSVFSDSYLPHDILGILGLAVLFIALRIRKPKLWLYYVYWVFAYWFGRVGFHDSNLAASIDGWQVILWSFWHGFICNEGRIFLVIALGLSIVVFIILRFMYRIKHMLQKRKYNTAEINLTHKRLNLLHNTTIARYWKGQHAKHRLQYHVVLIRKHSKRALSSEVVHCLKGLIYNCCKINRWWIDQMEIQYDHVHFLIQIQPNDSIVGMIQVVKNATSRAIHKEFPELEEFSWGDDFWQDGYFAETVGRVNEEIIRKYINEQRK